MADAPRYPDMGDDAGVGASGESITGAPRWVKVFGIIAIVLVLLSFALRPALKRLTSGGGGDGLAPGENQQQEIDTGDGDGHDPSRWGGH